MLDLHAVACQSDPPPPETLADWLLRLQTAFPEPPEVRLAPYAAALGERGLARYRAEAVARFERLPVVGFGGTGHYDRARWALLRVVEELAEHTGDVDLQVLRLSRDLSSGWHYLQVATVLREAGRPAQALEWVRRGLAATGGRGAAGRLADLGVDECLRHGEVGQALELCGDLLRLRPCPETYGRLRALAAATGQWPRVRERTWEHLVSAASPQQIAELVELELRSTPPRQVLEWVREAARRAGRPQAWAGCLDLLLAAVPLEGPPEGPPERPEVLLEPLRVSHAEEMVPVLADARLHAFTGGAPPTAQELRRRYAAQVAGPVGQAGRWWLNWVVRRGDDGRAAGFVQATVAEADEGLRAEVAWVVGVEHQGRGVARAASRLMVDWLRGRGVARVLAHVRHGHVASEAVARSVGLAPTGVVVDGERRWQD
ncbi:RimJ/RimL family protein N-acetyltransferase [Saccharothrix coeruleofusca]|uniref:GNAT family N-acetyltransferase n=1 Tax=Saccharothrix coeruleofusca TaxID=33919 RepID=UPI0027DDE5F1|nr:GNAT family N-acetyltransferase [Saccharothrix coeruleofusca]MBP2336336.1 RimJ/RimL family protein N-acetyltransferase [Saccharothrix coeruleofusca]